MVASSILNICQSLVSNYHEQISHSEFLHLHSPIQGAACVPPDPQDFASGDRVKAELDMDIIKALGEENPQKMEKFLMVCLYLIPY